MGVSAKVEKSGFSNFFNANINGVTQRAPVVKTKSVGEAKESSSSGSGSNSVNDWNFNEKLAGKTNEVATSLSIITAGLEATGKAAPYMIKTGKYAGNLGTFAQTIDNSIKVYKGEKNGGISPQRYGYRMIGTGASWGVGTAVAEWSIGGIYAGPYGVLAGIVIGGGFQGLEYSYDIIAPQIQASYNSFVNNLHTASYNAQFSGR